MLPCFAQPTCSADLDAGLNNDDRKNQTTGQLLETPTLPAALLQRNRNVLPVVTVRDPFTWFQSMCRARYSAHWYHVVPDHCPNFVASNVEREWFNKTKAQLTRHYKGDPWKVDNVLEKAGYSPDQATVPLWVRYHSENRRHRSLAHMWADWYDEYLAAGDDFPRLMLRLEDLVFRPRETLRRVCECVDGAFLAGDLTLPRGSAIQGSGFGVDNIHGKDRTGLLGAMAAHALSNRTRGMTPEDLDFALETLNGSKTMKYFRYTLPTHS